MCAFRLPTGSEKKMASKLAKNSPGAPNGKLKMTKTTGMKKRGK